MIEFFEPHGKILLSLFFSIIRKRGRQVNNILPNNIKFFQNRVDFYLLRM
nr:MAG TPA: hypothetical protein [Bacteriophage sp.]DAL33354.1 MAG TPA_asm: hypothetical protein [Caudoviricetes sp.]